MTLSDYIQKFKVAQGLVFATPLLQGWKNYPLPFPPMGDNSQTWLGVAVVFTGLGALLPYYMPSQISMKRVIWGLALLIFVIGGFYLHLNEKYVLSIRYSDASVSYVTRGTIRNPRLKEPYASMNDYDLVESSGLSDLALEKVYEKDSLLRNRRTLYSAYVTTLVFLQFLLGTAARNEIR